MGRRVVPMVVKIDECSFCDSMECSDSGAEKFWWTSPPVEEEESCEVMNEFVLQAGEDWMKRVLEVVRFLTGL